MLSLAVSASLFFLSFSTLISAGPLPMSSTIVFDPMSHFATNSEVQDWRNWLENEKYTDFNEECYRNQFEACDRHLNIRTYCCIGQAQGSFDDHCYRDAVKRGQRCYDALMTTAVCNLSPNSLERTKCCNNAFRRVTAMSLKEKLADDGCRPASDQQVRDYVNDLGRKMRLEEGRRLVHQ